MSNIKFKDYLHQDDAYDLADKLGFDYDKDHDNADAVANWAYELEFELELDTETHKVKILSVDGKKVIDE